MAESLQQLLDRVGNPVEHLRNVRNEAYVMPVIPSEYTTWLREQRAWRESVVLLDQSHHMDTTFLKGPDALRLLSDSVVNSVANLSVDRAKQYVAVAEDGHVIGDGIVFREAEESFFAIGRVQGQNWLRYRAESGGYDVEVEVDRRSPAHPMGQPVTRRQWRLQLQGPLAWALIEKLHGAPVAQAGFFHMGEIVIAGRRAHTLRHGMSGVPGLEMWGPYEDYRTVWDAIVEAGEEFGLVACGGRAYPTSTLESGWIPDPLPAIYTAPELRAYREWLPAAGAEGYGALAGSFVSDDIRDYYLTPWELGYGGFVKFDHDFIGRDALERIDPAGERKKVTFAWNPEDMTKLVGSAFGAAGDRGYKHFDLPLANYGYFHFDTVLDRHDAEVGFSMWTGYSVNERSGLSLGTVSPDVEIGSEVRVVWGEPEGGTRKSTVEPHEQFEVRAIVSPAPFATVAREDYRRD